MIDGERGWEIKCVVGFRLFRSDLGEEDVVTDTDRSWTSRRVEDFGSELMSESEDLSGRGEFRRDVHEHFVDGDSLQEVGVLEEDVVEFDCGGLVVVELERNCLKIGTDFSCSSETANRRQQVQTDWRQGMKEAHLMTDRTPDNRAS